MIHCLEAHDSHVAIFINHAFIHVFMHAFMNFSADCEFVDTINASAEPSQRLVRIDDPDSRGH